MSLTLYLIGQQVIMYSGIPLLIAGIIGGCLNIIVFMSLRTFRENSCAFYLTILSLMNVIQLLTGLLSRILITGFDIDLTRSSLFYCKLRPFILYVSALIASVCLCLATIDQYFATCIRIHWRYWCTIKLAHRLVIICSILCILEQIPTLVFYEHVISPMTNQITCSIINQRFSRFNNYFTVLTLWFLTPLIFTVFFASLAYRNVQQMTHRTYPPIRRELDKQLTVMVLVQVLVYFITLLPNFLVYILLINDSLTANLVFATRINFAYMICLCLFYVACSVSYLWIHFEIMICFFLFRVLSTFIYVHRNDFVDN